MKFKTETILELIGQLDEILKTMEDKEEQSLDLLESIDPIYQRSAQNLIHYNAFRSFDLSSIQKKLKNMGLTRFANAEGHIMASVLTTRYILGELVKDAGNTSLKKPWSIKKGNKRLNKHTKSLLGYRSKGRRVRIMVTQPSAAAQDYDLVHTMVKEGMNCARVNCAHDSPEVWEKIIANVRKASEAVGKSVKIAMDLGGPKIRTGQLPAGPKIRRFKPEKDIAGNIIGPVEVVLVPESNGPLKPNMLPISAFEPSTIKEGETLFFVDTRGKHRQLSVVKVFQDHVIAHGYKTIYIETGMTVNKTNDTDDFNGLIVGELPPLEQYLLLREGDILEIKKDDIIGRQGEFDEDGQMVSPHSISCQMPQVFDYINEGESVLFDDGKIGAVIVSVEKDAFRVKITLAKENGSKLKSYKGINFPDSLLGFSGLTGKDKKDLPFVAQHADIVNFSFVNNADDVRELHEELKKLEVYGALDVILKIETKYAFDNLLEILLEAMKSKQVGVMIARGDLAIEAGWENIGRVQREILSLCSAAHVPVVWATQVLENLAKNGLPSRSEITDATTALNAECVMLNKGPYIMEAIRLLNTILSKMESSQNKKEPMLPKMESFG